MIPYLKNRQYDALKWISQIVLPAIGALYFGLAQIWGLPKAEEIVGTIMVLDVFLGAVLRVSTSKYNNDPNQIDGYLHATGVDPDTGHPDLALTVTKMPADILKEDTAKLKVGPPPPTPPSR